jgi:hypothetical protein
VLRKMGGGMKKAIAIPGIKMIIGQHIRSSYLRTQGVDPYFVHNQSNEMHSVKHFSENSRE